jgi:hypothetical protein
VHVLSFLYFFVILDSLYFSFDFRISEICSLLISGLVKYALTGGFYHNVFSFFSDRLVIVLEPIIL